MAWRLINFAIGIWLMSAPYLLEYQGPAAINDRICGPLIAAFALIAASEVVVAVRYANVPFGLWLIAASFFLGGYESAAMWNSVISGAAVAVIALFASPQKQTYAGGWKEVFEVKKWQ